MLKKAILIFTVLLQQTASASTNETVEQIQNRTLVVVLESPTKLQLSTLAPDEQLLYQKAVENYNRKLKEVVDNFWSTNSKKEFKTWDEVNTLLKNKAEGYLLFYAGNYSVDPSTNDFMMQKGMNYSPSIYATSDKRSYNIFYTSFRLSYLEEFKKGKSIFSRTITNLWPLKEDIIFACQYMQSLLTETKRTNIPMTVESVASSHHDELLKSTLLLKNNLLHEVATNESVKTVYPYSFEIITHDSLLSKIFDKQNVTYIEIVPQMVGTGEAYRLGYEHILVNAKSGMVVGYVPVNAGILHATAGNGYHHKYISLGIFEDYLHMETRNVVPSEPKE